MKKLLPILLLVPMVSFGQTASDFIKSGVDKQNLKDYTGALIDFTKAIALNPYSVNAYNNRGQSKRRLKDYYGAIKDFSKSIEIGPTAAAYSNRGMVKRLLKDY